MSPPFRCSDCRLATTIHTGPKNFAAFRATTPSITPQIPDIQVRADRFRVAVGCGCAPSVLFPPYITCGVLQDN
jgi:hypothetical protein